MRSIVVQSRGRSMAPAAAASRRSGLLLLLALVACCCLVRHHGGTAMAFQVDSSESGAANTEEQQLLSVSSTHADRRRRLLSSSHGPGPKPTTLASVINETTYDLFFLHRNDAACPARGFFDYSALVEAARAFPGFATCGSQADRKREVAAFLAQTSHETTGGWATAPDGPYAWGYCFKEEINQANDYCDAASTQWPCVAGQKYFGRGPIQLSWNFNYGPAGQALGFDGLANPGLLATDPVLSFKSALWFWMTPQPPKPSAHDVILGRYRATPADAAAGRGARPGYGLITNIINGGLECGPANNPAGVTNAFQLDRIGFYQRYTHILGVSTGPNLDCTNQAPYGA